MQHYTPPMTPTRRIAAALCGLLCMVATVPQAAAKDFAVTQNADQIHIVGPELEATIRKRGYVSGVAGGSLWTGRPAFATRDSDWTSWIGSWSPAATRPIATSCPS